MPHSGLRNSETGPGVCTDGEVGDKCRPPELMLNANPITIYNRLSASHMQPPIQISVKRRFEDGEVLRRPRLGGVGQKVCSSFSRGPNRV